MFRGIDRLYSRALKEHFALGGFNFSTSCIAKAIFLKARELRAPFILETSSSEMEFLVPEVSYGIWQGLTKTDPTYGKGCILHLDHGKSFDIVKKAIGVGYPSVHIDGSELPFKENVRVTKKVVRLAHSNDVWVEGELGHVAGSSTLHKDLTYKDVLKTAVFTDPEQAKEFVESTGVNSLAVTVGNVHGIWKGTPHIDFSRLRAIFNKTKLPLVLHGGSGIPRWQIKKALQNGIAKVNINTESRVAYTASIRKSLMNKEEFVPTNYLPKAIDAVQKVVEQKIELFNSSNKIK